MVFHICKKAFVGAHIFTTNPFVFGQEDLSFHGKLIRKRLPTNNLIVAFLTGGKIVPLKCPHTYHFTIHKQLLPSWEAKIVGYGMEKCPKE